MEGQKVMAHIYSLDGEMREVTIVKKESLFGRVIPNSYIFDYNGIRCTGIYNVCNGQYYVDDVYGKV